MGVPRRARAIAAVLWVLVSPVAGRSQDSPATARVFDFSFRLPARTTDRAYLTDRPKASAAILSQEAFISARFASEHWEGKADARFTARRTNVAGTDRDQFFGAFELGPRWGATSLVLDWQPSHFYEAHTNHELLEQQEIGLKFKHMTPLAITGHNPVSFFLEVSNVNAIPYVFSRKRLYGEAQWTVRSGANVRTVWAPEVSLARYENFFGKRRSDASLGLRRTTRREFGSGLSIGLSLYAVATASTLSQKSGFEFEVRPDIRFRMQ
jgi:hypothetical protein